MTNFDFHDVGSIRPRLTWCNNKEGASRIWEKLDRCLLNSATLQLLPSTAIRHLARVASNHSPIAFKLDDKMKNDFGDKGMVLQRKINRTLKALFFWSKNKCKDLNELMERLKKDIMELQHKEAMGVNWSAHDLLLLRSWPETLAHQKLIPEEITALSTDFSLMELQHSVFQQGNNRSPGMDGLTSSFYKYYLDIVWKDLWNAINSFFTSGCMRKDWKDTLIVLIDKVKNPLLPSNYCPISLCLTNYKIVATMLVNSLKTCIPKLITEEQMAFIPGRSISEHCLLAQEIFHMFKVSKNRKGLMALKLDMEQAYDSMGWPTLDHVLKWYGFPSIYANLIMECIVDVRFSIIINGKNSKWIIAHSGFRQGCPLSPYLYIMCSQLMSNSIEQRGQNIGIQISPRGPRITHLLYADDVLIFSHVSKEIAKEVKGIVEDFCNWTGQRINVNKSHIIFGHGVSNPRRNKIAKVFGFKVVKEMNYLGIKISLNRLKADDLQDLLTSVMDRLNAWGKKFLSMGGKITLITSSLFSMPNFLVTHSLIPKRVLVTLEKLCRDFIWHKPDGSHSIHYVAWDDLCKTRSMGGLGLQSPVMKAGSLRSNLAWNFLQKPDTLFHITMKAKYGKNFMNGTHNKITSKAWQIILDGERHLKNITRWKVGNGEEINVLNDFWILDRCLKQWPTFVDCVALEGTCVQQLILEYGHWNFPLLQEVFHPELIMLINQIQFDSSREDRLEMQKFCSKKTIFAMSFDHVIRCRFNLRDDDYCKWLNKLMLNKKVEMFWQRLGKSSIPTNLFLRNHKISGIDSCARGCQMVGSYEHIIVQCKYLIEIIMQVIEWGISIPVFHSLDNYLKELRRISTSNLGIVKIYCTIIYLSWKNRNDVKHSKAALPCYVVAANALSMAITKTCPYLSNWGTNLLRESQNTWCPPPKDWMKINVDASLISSGHA
ncbi:uncharacterized protein LOC110092712 [Dendrobium catenatum]|uniref:uncharacterized protein LOC110092712 n=1 Tax=Dendrobium catenatum TaxID=906689 RepID=UPI0009F444BA|nr:uncharacterized protein LOC110092712 [Dendrobium catenatum]